MEYYSEFSSPNAISPLRVFLPLHHNLAPQSGVLRFRMIIADIACSGYRRRLAAAHGGVAQPIGWEEPEVPLLADARIGLRDFVARLREWLPVLEQEVMQNHNIGRDNNNNGNNNGAGTSSALREYPHIPRSYSLSHHLYSRRFPSYAKLVVATLIICKNTPTTTSTTTDTTTAAGEQQQQQQQQQQPRDESYVRPAQGASSANFRAGPLRDNLWDVRGAVARVDILGLNEDEWTTVRELLWAGGEWLKCYMIVKGEPCFA